MVVNIVLHARREIHGAAAATAACGGIRGAAATLGGDHAAVATACGGGRRGVQPVVLL